MSWRSLRSFYLPATASARPPAGMWDRDVNESKRLQLRRTPAQGLTCMNSCPRVHSKGHFKCPLCSMLTCIHAYMNTEGTHIGMYCTEAHNDTDVPSCFNVHMAMCVPPNWHPRKKEMACMKHDCICLEAQDCAYTDPASQASAAGHGGRGCAKVPYVPEPPRYQAQGSVGHAWFVPW